MRYYFLSRNYEQKQKLTQEPKISCKHNTATSCTRENIDSSFHIFPQIVILGVNSLNHIVGKVDMSSLQNLVNNETKQA